MSNLNDIIFEPANLKISALGNFNPLYRIGDYAGYTPPQVATAYSIPDSDGAGIKIGIIAPGGGGFLQSDLNKTFADLIYSGLIAAGTPTPIITQVLLDGQTGDFVDSGVSLENTLDIYCLATLVPAADIIIYIGSNFVSTTQQAIDDGCDIISVSYTVTGGEPSSGTMDAFEYFLLSPATDAKIAICVASGDSGSTFEGLSTVKVAYPASSPNVIAVGGTKLILNNNDTRLSESDNNRDPDYPAGWGGGGGLSGYFPAPEWQSGLNYTPIINGTTGTQTTLTQRGLPDISAAMSNYLMYYDGSIIGIGGTSASAPVVAGILARFQSLTGKQRSSPEYNKLFYNHTDSFFDILVGTNNTLITSGYKGTVSWDPVTGLGPPTGNQVYRYIKNGLRPVNGDVFPNNEFDKRPASGMVWPRTKTL